MKTPIKHNHRIPVPVWEEERILELPILHLSPRRSSRVRSVELLGPPRLRQRFITPGGPDRSGAGSLSRLNAISIYVRD